MSHESAPAAKVCIVCHQDCSNRSRQRDAQGRYVCQDCLNKAKEKAAAGGAAPAAPAKKSKAEAAVDPGLAAALQGVDQAAMAPCPSCGVLLKPDAALCTNCGFDVGKGRAIKTRFSVEKGAKEKGDFKLPISWDIVAGVMIFLIIGSGVFAAVAPAGVIAFWIALGLCNFLIWLMVIITPFQDGNTGWGMYNLFGPLIFPGMLMAGYASCWGMLLFLAYPFAVIYYIFMVNWRPSLKRLFWAGLMGGIMLSILATMHGADRIMESIGLDPNDYKMGDKDERPTRGGESNPAADASDPSAAPPADREGLGPPP